MAKKKTKKRSRPTHGDITGQRPPADLDPLVQYAKDYGHFFNPDVPTLAELVDANDGTLAKIRPGDALYRDVASSIQGFDANMDQFSGLHHGRAAMLDGDVGPATRGLIELKRCQCPDFPNPIAATGTGGWPEGCDPKRPEGHSIRIAVNTRGINDHWRERLPGVLKAAEEISASIGLVVRHIIDGDEDKEQSISFGTIRGGVIGWNYLPQANTCQQVLEGKIDTSYQPSDPIFNALLWIHESHGHGVGLPHTRGGIMNPSILKTPVSWKDDPSFARLRRFYGGIPIAGGPKPPTPLPVPTPGVGYKLRGIVELEKDGVKTGERWTFAPV